MCSAYLVLFVSLWLQEGAHPCRGLSPLLSALLGSMRFLRQTVACLSTLSLFRSCLGSHTVEVPWVELPCHFCEISQEISCSSGSSTWSKHRKQETNKSLRCMWVEGIVSWGMRGKANTERDEERRENNSKHVWKTVWSPIMMFYIKWHITHINVCVCVWFKWSHTF